MSVAAKSQTLSTPSSMCSTQTVPSIPRKRRLQLLIAENLTLLQEEPNRKKFKASELLERSSKGNVSAKKSVTFSDDVKEVRFRKRDTPRSLLLDGIDEDAEDDIEGYEDDTKYHIQPTPLQNITLTPQQRALKRTISFQEVEFDDQFGEELDSQLTSMHLGEVKS